MSISWINISIKKQHNTTRVITLQTRTTHALSTTTPETGGFLHKKLTATEETGADTRTKNASGKDTPTGGHEDSNISIYEYVADKRTTSSYKFDKRTTRAGFQDGDKDHQTGARTQDDTKVSTYDSGDLALLNAAQCKKYQVKTERQSTRATVHKTLTEEPGIPFHQRRLARRAPELRIISRRFGL